MINWFKKHFIPHAGNNHRPHFLRIKNIRNVVIVVLFLEIFTFLIPTLTHINMKGGMAAVLPAVLANLTNDERQAENLAVLTVNPILNKAAEMKAEDMATYGYFAHTSPEGKTPWSWIEKVGYQYQYAGENLAINFTDSKDVTDAWMASPTHKANIVKGNYTEVGTGVATGMYEGKETVFVAQVYANPMPQAEVQTKTIQPEARLNDSFGQVTKEVTPKVAIEEKIPPARDASSIANAGGEPSNVLGAEVSTQSTDTMITGVQNPTFWQKAFASPRNTMNTILYIVFGIIVIALFLYIVIKMKNHHQDLITNGLIVIAIIGAIFIANYYFSHRNMVTTASLDYSNEIK